MTQVQTILRGAKSPEACRFALTPGDLDLDMTDVSAVSLEVRQCNGVTQTWDTVIEAGATAPAKANIWLMGSGVHRQINRLGTATETA